MFEAVFSIVLIVAVVSVFTFYFFVKKREGKDWIYAIYFLTILILGTVLFSLALVYREDSDTSFSMFFVVARAICLSLKSFGGEFSSSVVSKLAKDNSFIMIASFIHYIGAIILTFLIAIKLFGKNLINRVKIFINSFRSKYIVLGLSEESEIFLNSFSGKKRKRIVVILEPSQKDKKRELMFDGFCVIVIKNDKAYENITQNTLEALKIAGFDKNKTRVVSMSKSDEFNLLIAKIITDYILENVKPLRESNGRIAKLSSQQESILEKIKLSAYIMYGFLDRTEHFSFSEYALGRVKFFNPFEVRARKFMLENPITSLIPTEWINTKKARLYNSSDSKDIKPFKISSFFIGYGLTNQQLLKKSICNYQLLSTDYNALIIDRDAKRLEKQFKNSSIGLTYEKDESGKIIFGSELKGDSSLYFPSPSEKYNIEFADYNVLSSEFYKKIIDEIGGNENKPACDFVSIIIALGNDKLSIETALEIRQKLYERKLLKGKTKDGEYDRVRIFVKILRESVLSDNSLLNDENDISSKITTFGASDEILNESYIINEQLDVIAKRLANDYWRNSGSYEQKTNIVSKWDSLTEFKRDSNRYASMSIRVKLNLLGFELGEGKTDEQTAKDYMDSYDIDLAKKQRQHKERGEFVDFALRDKGGNIIDNARNNLARMEHQRWNTVHLCEGWTKLKKGEVCADMRQDEKSKQHACITTFEGLTELREIQANDAVKKSKISRDRALSEADTVCYDYDVMDYLLEHCEALNLRIYKK